MGLGGAARLEMSALRRGDPDARAVAPVFDMRSPRGRMTGTLLVRRFRVNGELKELA